MMFCSLTSEGKVEIFSNNGSGFVSVQTIVGFNLPTKITLVKGKEIVLIANSNSIVTIKESAGSYFINQNLTLGVQVRYIAISEDRQSLLYALQDRTLRLFIHVDGTYVLN